MSETLERPPEVGAGHAIRLNGVGKVYRVFPSRSANFVDALGLSRLLPRSRPRYEEFWALRGVDFELEKGARLGIIGRNGAGKTKMLKLITGAVAATEGTIETSGTVQALLEASAGLHPSSRVGEHPRGAHVPGVRPAPDPRCGGGHR